MMPEQKQSQFESAAEGPTREAPVEQPLKEGVGKESTIYTSRFTPQEEQVRTRTWQVLVDQFFQRYVGPNETVVDIGAGDGLFIRNIRAGRRIAVDLSEHVQRLTAEGIEVYQVPATEFTGVVPVKADVIFMSNFLEHLPDKRILLQVFEECRRGLAPGGRLLILQPNIRYVGPAYWDYVDHHIALTEHSLSEGLEVCGFKVEQLIPRFLPYTAKSSLGHLAGQLDEARLVSWYLRAPLLWRIFGQQTFIVATASGR